MILLALEIGWNRFPCLRDGLGRRCGGGAPAAVAKPMSRAR